MTTPLLTPGGHGLGYGRDTPDDRDLYFTTPAVVAHQFVDLSLDPAMPSVWDQGQLGSCTAHGTLAAFLFAAAKLGLSLPMLSRLQLYYNARALEGTTSTDSGAMIRDAIKAAAAGVAPESDWAYDISKFAEQPPASVQGDSHDQAVQYASVETSRDALQSVLSSGFPVVNGLTLFESFESDEAMSTGIVRHPKRGEQEIGGHCQLIVGMGFGHEWKAAGQFPALTDADMGRLWVKVRNSWGTGVYQDGYELIGVPYQGRYGSDFWVVRAAN